MTTGGSFNGIIDTETKFLTNHRGEDWLKAISEIRKGRRKKIDNKNHMNKKHLVIGAVMLGFAVGAIVGLNQIQKTKSISAVNGEKPTATITEGREIRVESKQVERGATGIKEFQKNPELKVNFVGTAWNPYLEKATDNPVKFEPVSPMLTYKDEQNWEYWVDLETYKIIQIGPGAIDSLNDPTPKFDFTPRYTKKELQKYAMNWLKERGVNEDLRNLKFEIGTKDERGYFFQWTNTEAPEGEMRVLQVGFTIGGSLLSYTNTL